MNRWVNLDELMELFGTCSDEDVNARLNIEDAISTGNINVIEREPTEGGDARIQLLPKNSIGRT